MDLQELRNEIDSLDREILTAFEKRMQLCRGVAKYKTQNNLPVFQSGREKEIIEKVTKNSPEDLKAGAAALFTEIMDISKSLQQQYIFGSKSFMESKPFTIDPNAAVGCQGISGSNSEAAARKLFKDNEITFYHEFEDVFSAVENEEIQYGILPIHNSTAGSVTQTYDLMKKHDVYIAKTIKFEITHCLAAKKGTKSEDIKTVYSHPQALAQCSAFLRRNGFQTVPYENTATAAKLASENDGIAAVCSEECAALYNLEIIKKGIANTIPNFTRFICITKDLCVPEDAGTIAVTLEIPNSEGSLYRILTKFFVNGMNLEKIESRPVADGSFDVMFYLDFEGNISDTKTSALLDELKNQLDYFKFLGNYSEII